MTAYRNFIADFPVRCTEILSTFYDVAKTNDREVTLMLAVAAAALIVPYERLRLYGNDKKPHPYRDRDRPEFGIAKDGFDRLLKQPFLESSIWCPKEPCSWQYGKVDKNLLRGDPDQWVPRAGHASVTVEQSCNDVLFVLRNALAHGNIWNLLEPGQTEPPQIAKLVFVRVPAKCQTAYFAAATPKDFGALLKSWVEFLRANTLPKDVVEESEHFTAAAA